MVGQRGRCRSSEGPHWPQKTAALCSRRRWSHCRRWRSDDHTQTPRLTPDLSRPLRPASTSGTHWVRSHTLSWEGKEMQTHLKPMLKTNQVVVCCSVCVFTCLSLQLHVWPPLLTESLSRHCTRTGSSASTHTQKIKNNNIYSLMDPWRNVKSFLCCANFIKIILTVCTTTQTNPTNSPSPPPLPPLRTGLTDRNFEPESHCRTPAEPQECEQTA